MISKDDYEEYLMIDSLDILISHVAEGLNIKLTDELTKTTI